jgi:hypothetical protein
MKDNMCIVKREIFVFTPPDCVCIAFPTHGVAPSPIPDETYFEDRTEKVSRGEGCMLSLLL